MKHSKKIITVILLYIVLFPYAQLPLYFDFDADGSGEYFGYSVSTNYTGNTFVTGAPSNSTGNYNEGYGIVYYWNGHSWLQKGGKILGENSLDNFGISTSMDSLGNRIVIGANKNYGNGVHAGHVRVFNWDGQSWQQMGIDIEGEAAGNQLGKSVSISNSGQRIAVGAPYHSSNSAQRGHVRILEWNGSSWLDIGQDIRGLNQDDKFGYAVSLSGDGEWIAIGAIDNDDNGNNSGHVRVYHYNGLGWIKKGQDIVGETNDDNFGYSLQLNANGTRLVVGAPHNDGNGSDAGHARVFEWDGTNWFQLGQDLDSESSGDEFGTSVSINYLGDKVAVGGVYNSGAGLNAGYVRIFNFDGNSWVQEGLDIDAESSGDSFGRSLSLNGTGNRVVCGANGNDGAGNSAGHVRLFSTCGTATTQTITSCGEFIWVDSLTYLNDTTIHYYYLENSNGCDSILSLNLTVNPLPPVDFSSNLNLLNNPPFAFQFNNITGNLSDHSFTWNFGDGTIIQNNNALVFHEYLYNGLYSVSLIAESNLNGCIDTVLKSDYIYCTGGSSLSVSEHIYSLNIYPNPAYELIQIDIENFNGSFEVQLYDFTGKLLETTNNTSVNLSDYPSGIYFLKVVYGDKAEELRVVKE